MKHSYYKLAVGGYMVCCNDEPLWEVKTKKQAELDIKELEAAD